MTNTSTKRFLTILGGIALTYLTDSYFLLSVQGKESAQGQLEKSKTAPPENRTSTDGGGLFYCGHLGAPTRFGQAVFPDYVCRYEGGYDLQPHKSIGANHPRREPQSNDILILGRHGYCALPSGNHSTPQIQRRTGGDIAALQFPGKVLVLNGEPTGDDITKDTVFKGRQDIFQIGSVPDSNNTVLSYYVVWGAFLFRYLKEDERSTLHRLYDRNQKPINTGKYNAMIYTNSNCQGHRDQAVNEISAIMPIHVGGASQGAMPHKGTFVPAPKSMSRANFQPNHELYKDYKFCFDMENSYQDQYISEKILNPFLAGCIPIYYKTLDGFNLFNHKAMIYYDPKNPAPALKQIRELSQNEALYNEMLHNQPILAHGNETLKQHFSLLEEIEGGYLKHKIRTMMGVS